MEHPRRVEGSRRRGDEQEEAGDPGRHDVSVISAPPMCHQFHCLLQPPWTVSARRRAHESQIWQGLLPPAARRGEDVRAARQPRARIRAHESQIRQGRLPPVARRGEDVRAGRQPRQHQGRRRRMAAQGRHARRQDAHRQQFEVCQFIDREHVVAAIPTRI